MMIERTTRNTANAPHVNVIGPNTTAPANMLPFQRDLAGSHFTRPATALVELEKTSELTL